MNNRFVFYALILVVVMTLLWIFGETFNQPGPKDLDTKFIETAFYRNENNTGPIIRIYAVYAQDTVWNDMKAYGGFMPHTKYGQTKIYFFNSLENSPRKLKPDFPYFESEYQSICIGLYEKNPMGQENLIKFPFR